MRQPIAPHVVGHYYGSTIAIRTGDSLILQIPRNIRRSIIWKLLAYQRRHPSDVRRRLARPIEATVVCPRQPPVRPHDVRLYPPVRSRTPAAEPLYRVQVEPRRRPDGQHTRIGALPRAGDASRRVILQSRIPYHQLNPFGNVPGNMTHIYYIRTDPKIWLYVFEWDVARPPRLGVCTARDVSTSRIKHIHVEVRVCAHPGVVPPQLEIGSARTRRYRHGLVVSMKIDVSVAISVGVPTQPSRSASVPRRVHPGNAVLHCTIYAPKRAVFARRRPVPGTVESPRQRLVDDLHTLGNHPIHGVL